MNFADTLRGLLRRWYIVIPGLLIAASVAVGAWFAVPPGYSRSATQLLIPGESSIPEGGNPYLFLGGLAPAADVLVRAVGSENVLNEVVEEHPGIEIEISRDTTTGGPIILISVTAASDAAAEEVLTMLIERTATLLDEFQEEEEIREANRMTVIPVTVDEKSEVEQRSRLITTAGAGILGTVLTLLVAALVDGASLRRQERNNNRPAPQPLEAVSATVTVPTAKKAKAQPRKAPSGPLDDEPVPESPHTPVRG